MKSTIKRRIKSKTYWLGHIAVILGLIETNAPLLRDNLGEWYGFLFIGLGIATYIIREMTTQSLEDKE